MIRSKPSIRTFLLILLAFLIIAGSAEFAFYTAVLHPAQLHAQATVSVLTKQEQRREQAAARLQATAKNFEGLYLQTTHNTPMFADSLSENDTNNWDEFETAGSSSCVFTGKVYRASEFKSEVNPSLGDSEHAFIPKNTTACFAQTMSFSDFALSVQMKIIKGDEGGVFINCQGILNDPSYLQNNPLLFGITRKGFYELTEEIRGKTLLGGRSLAFKRGLQQSNLIAITVHGNDLSLYVNGQYADHIDFDGFYTFCTFGLFARSNIEPSQPTVVEFSNLQVWHVTPTFHTTPLSPATTSSDYPMFGFNPQHTRVNPNEHVFTPGNVSHLVPAWTATTGNSILSSPVEANGIVYVGSFDHKLYAFDAKTGKIRWSTPKEDSTNKPFSPSTPAVANGMVYIGTDNDRLKAFDAKTGQLRWASARTEASIVSSPVVAGGAVYVGSSDHALYAFDAITGNFLWAAFTTASIYSSPAVANGVVYVGSNNSELYAFDASTGKTLWTASTGKAIFSSPAVVNGTVYVGSEDGKLYAFDVKTGKTLWTAPTGGAIFSSPVVAGGLVYIGSFDQSLYAFNGTTGGIVWSDPTDGAVFSSPVVAGDVIFVGSEDGKLYAFDATTGDSLWSASTGNRIFSSPTLAGDMVYVGSNDSRLYAFHLSSK